MQIWIYTAKKRENIFLLLSPKPGFKSKTFRSPSWCVSQRTMPTPPLRRKNECKTRTGCNINVLYFLEALTFKYTYKSMLYNFINFRAWFLKINSKGNSGKEAVCIDFSGLRFTKPNYHSFVFEQVFVIGLIFLLEKIYYLNCVGKILKFFIILAYCLTICNSCI